MYLASLAMTIVMYIFFARGGCSMNQASITVSHSALLHYFLEIHMSNTIYRSISCSFSSLQ
jgi:hypothetical protein